MSNIVTVTCRHCGKLPITVRPDDGLCPTCRTPVNTHTLVRIDEYLPRMHDSHRVSFKGPSGRKITASAGYVLDRDTKTIARFWQLVDKDKRRYAKVVVLPDKTIKKHQDGHLRDQSLHGRQRGVMPDGPLRNLEHVDKIGPDLN